MIETSVKSTDSFNTKDTFKTDSGSAVLYRLDALEKQGVGDISRLPFSIRVLLEALLRTEDGFEVTADDVLRLANWDAHASAPAELPFKPGRVIMQDFTGLPAVVDLAALRSSVHRMGGDPVRINPLVPVDIVIDHSVQVDYFGDGLAITRNAEQEFVRNGERYAFLAWASQAFDNLRVVPPATGIIHQVNLEYLASVVVAREIDGDLIVYPDTLVGTDSHTTMINGLGVLGWGVGGIEAEAVMLGQPLYMLTPEVVGFKLVGALSEGATATDLALTIVEQLRAHGVVGKFVEFFGPALSSMSLPDRATIANMAPEYGATMGFFPVDDETLSFLRRTGRNADLVERYTKEQGLFCNPDTPDPEFSATLELDLGMVRPSMAGPKRPQDRVLLKDMKTTFQSTLTAPLEQRGFALEDAALHNVAVAGDAELCHGSVVIAAITSCTNTSNPSVMLGAGLLARKAVEKGLTVQPYVKTSLAPGSRVVTEYMNAAGLTPYLEQLGFHTVGYGCTTCIGNSGPLAPEVNSAIESGDLVAAAVLSGNRNFEGRIHSHIKANYLASPPLVVAYALAGTVDIDMDEDPLGTTSDGNPVFLRDIWPTQAEVTAAISAAVKTEHYVDKYANVFEGSEAWNQVASSGSNLYEWDESSTYIQEPPFFVGIASKSSQIESIRGARVLALLGDTITTDHISPAGKFSPDSPAGQYLLSCGVAPEDFNSYGTRRGNDRVMMRGTFANIRLQNQLVPGVEGGFTLCFCNGDTPEEMTIFDASQIYRAQNTPLIVVAGVEYGAGSSRDWAAKGAQLLGVRAVIASSFERIHRCNLVGMGILPLQFEDGETWKSLGLTGYEIFDIRVPIDLQAQQSINVRASVSNGSVLDFTVKARVDTPVEVEYYRNGGILQTVLRSLLEKE
ncbi:MAG: aconitate hydratase AcnA [Anaerolineales bacterium]|nr:aconitate hydratase AcnA [Anaerolineales bacterium]